MARTATKHPAKPKRGKKLEAEEPDIAAIIKKTYRLSSSLKKATDLPGNMVSALLKLTQIAPCQAVPISGKISSA